MHKQSGKDRFKQYLCKIGSGQETGRSLTRKESADALKLLLNKVPTPAQTGAFLIAHRIKRPTAKELTGMLDTYKELGPTLQSGKEQKQPIFFGMPFDGRTRTSPIYPLTTLILISAGQPVILQGGSRMPVKYGITTLELFQTLGLDLQDVKLNHVQSGFLKNNFAFIYQPNHFPLAENLISFRDEIGKRPTIASLELIWCAHKGQHIHISGYVHTETEQRHWEALNLYNEDNIITIKGLEGSIDLPVARKFIGGHCKAKKSHQFEINAADYNLNGKDISLYNLNQWKELALAGLNNEGPLLTPMIWNAAVYFWITGITNSINDGIHKAKDLISSKSVKNTLESLINWRQTL